MFVINNNTSVIGANETRSDEQLS